MRMMVVCKFMAKSNKVQLLEDQISDLKGLVKFYENKVHNLETQVCDLQHAVKTRDGMIEDLEKSRILR